MRKRFYRGVFSIVLTALLIVVGFVNNGKNTFAKTTSEKLQEAQAQRQEAAGKLQETKGKIGSLETGKAALQGYLNELNNDLTEVSERLSDIEDQLSKKEEQIEETDGEISELETKINQAQLDLETVQKELDDQYDFMKKRIRCIYEKGESSYVDVFFASSSFADLLNHAEYVEKANEYDQKLLQNMKEKKAEITEKKADIEKTKQEVEEKRRQQEEERSAIEGLQDDAAAEQGKVQGLVKQTSSGISSYSGEIAKAEADAAGYEEEIAKKDADIKALEAQLAKERELEERSRKMSKKDLSQINVAEGERELLACLIYCEAGGESYEGQVAVGAVVMNRCMSGAFPDTITGVIYQSGQFAPVASGRLATRLAQGANDSCYKAADAALEGHSPVGNCLFFRTVIPEIHGQVIGNHVFYNPSEQ